MREAAASMGNLPAQAKVFKDIIDSIQRVMAMERDAYGLNAAKSGDRPTAIVKDCAGRGDAASPFSESK